MALITFPRDLPCELPAFSVSFTLEPMNAITPLRSGRVIAVELGPNLWRCQFNADQVTMANLDVVRAWHDTLMSIESFYCYDRMRPGPKAHPSIVGLTVGGSPFNGTCVLSAVAANNLQPTLTGLPNGFVVSVGDYLSFDYATDSRALHRVVAGGTATAGSVQVEVRPSIRSGWAAAAVVQLYRPAAKMFIVPRSYSETVKRPGRVGSVSFEAIQTL